MRVAFFSFDGFQLYKSVVLCISMGTDKYLCICRHMYLHIDMSLCSYTHDCPCSFLMYVLHAYINMHVSIYKQQIALGSSSMLVGSLIRITIQ